MANVKWGRVVLWIVLGALIAFVISNGFMLIAMFVRGFQLRGAPPQEEQVAFILGPIYNTVGIIASAVGGLLGGRAVARKSEGSYSVIGLIVGVGVGLLMGGFASFQRGSFTYWSPLHLVLGIVGGYLGGMLGGKRAQSDEMYD